MVPCLLCFAYSTMFDFLRSKFYKKTKSLLKLSKKRLEAAKKRRFVVSEHLKNDLAELLRKGFDLEASKRVEGLLAEENTALCYESLEQCNSTIFDQLSNMENQRECPSECREAVATLMHAAARFADLPEAQKLRNVFTERYGSFPANFVSKEFVARLSTEPPSQERKIQILEDVAQEFSIPWDPRSLREQLFKPAPAVQEKLDVPTSNRGNDSPYDRYNVPSGSEDEFVSNHRRRDSGISQDSRQTGSSPSGSSLSEDEVDSRKANHYGLIPPPYVKQNNVKGGGNVEEPMRSNDPPITKSNEARHRKAKSEVPASSARVSSMSPEANDNYESMKKHGRSNSLQPEMLAGHVHPKLPDYDDLLARLAAREINVEEPMRSNDPPITKSNEARHRKAKSEVPASPARVSSMSPETNDNYESMKKHRRANSLQPAMLPGHVHPKLPDYDELLATLAPLRGRQND